MRTALVAGCLCLVVMSCGSGVAPENIRTLLVVSGNEQTDTVQTALPAPLVLQYRDAWGVPQAGVPVTIESPGPPWRISLRREDMVFSSLTVTDTTDSQGEVRVYVEFSTIAGLAWIHFSAPSAKVADSTSFTIRPGKLVHLMVGPSDTATYVGNSVQLRAQTFDSYGNDRGDPVDWSVTPAQTITLAAPGQVRGVQVGRGVVYAHIQQFSDSVGINVVPPGQIVALLYADGLVPYVAVFNNDGTGFQRIDIDMHCGAHGLQWSASGDHLLFSRTASAQLCSPVKLLTSTMTGVVTRLLRDTSALAAELWPRTTLDGQWIYFTGRPDADYQNGEIWRARADGSAEERIGPAAGLHDADQAPWPSPDGSQVVYDSWRDGEAVTSLRVVNTTTRLVSDLGVTGYSPSWSPDGTQIALVRDDQYWVVHSDGSGERRLSTARYSWGLPDPASWSPDSKWVVVVIDDRRLALVNVETDLTLPLGWTQNLTYPGWRPTTP